MATLALLLVVAVGARGLGARTENRTETNRHDAVARFRSFQACVTNFEIHTDKIIRTDDSRKMGAQYISETDVATRDECVRLCCTTDLCDVFVFEDKRPGSCYLFNCGSSDDFKCKFTKHHNYTSGIMTESHQGGEPQERDLPSKHEQELNLLRMAQESSGVNRTAPRAQQLPGSGNPPVPAAEAATERTPAEKKTVDPPPPERNTCSRFQFKCRMSGDCIAIYNACDGIPQCADGSDESAELNCPIAATAFVLLPAAAAPSARPKSDPDLPAYDSGFQHPSKEQPVEGNVVALKSADPEAEARGRVESDGAAEAERTNAAFHNLNAFDAAQPRLSEEPPLKKKKTPPLFDELPRLQPHVTKPDDMGQSNPPSPYTGYRPYMNAPREQEPENMAEEEEEEEERAYLAAKAYRSQFLQQEQSSMKKAAAPFKLLSRPPFSLQAADALRHLSEEAPVHQEPEASRGEGFNAHAHDANMQKAPSESLPRDYNRNEMKMATQMASYADPPPPPPPPPRLYKYEDENRHIFTHKGYGLVADGDRGELAPRKLIPGVRYKAEREGSGHHLLVAPQQQHQDKLFKILKNTPEPLEGENGYLVPADYLYDEMQLRPQPVNPNLQQRLHDFHHHVEAVAAHSAMPAAENTSSGAEEKPPERLREVHSQSKEAEKNSFLRSHHEHVVDVQEAPDEQQRERPSGALLSMSFGLCITLIMAVLVACRLKVVKRRFRRNGKSMYAHDADYLVNGMYL